MTTDNLPEVCDQMAHDFCRALAKRILGEKFVQDLLVLDSREPKKTIDLYEDSVHVLRVAELRPTGGKLAVVLWGWRVSEWDLQRVVVDLKKRPIGQRRDAVEAYWCPPKYTKESIEAAWRIGGLDAVEELLIE